MPIVENNTPLKLSEKDAHIHFDQGIPGFEELKEYVFTQPIQEVPFYELQAVGDSRVRFWITNPFLFEKTYHFELSDGIVDDLDIRSEEEVAVFAIVTVRESWDQATMNLAAPLIMNTRNRKCRQYILTETEYVTKHKLSPEPKGEA